MTCEICTSYAYALNKYGQISGVICLPCNTFIPAIEGVPEYQKFLAWVAAGNTPAEIYY